MRLRCIMARGCEVLYKSEKGKTVCTADSGSSWLLHLRIGVVQKRDNSVYADADSGTGGYHGELFL